MASQYQIPKEDQLLNEGRAHGTRLRHAEHEFVLSLPYQEIYP